MTKRIDDTFARLKKENQAGFVAYFMGGDPDFNTSLEIMKGLPGAGADIIELGVPFSDPMAEGPVIQLAHERALAHGTSLRDALALVTEFRRDDSTTPVLLMGYTNPVERMGFAAFADAATEASVDALLTVDLPPEEVGLVNLELQRVGMDNIFLVAPTTPQQRIGRITGEASGFVYYVSLKGVTGAGNLDLDAVSAGVAAIRECTELPVAVGFGIKDAASARAVAAIADGVVVGSALVDCVAQALASGGDQGSAIDAAGDLLQEIRQGIDSIAS